MKRQASWSLLLAFSILTYHCKLFDQKSKETSRRTVETKSSDVLAAKGILTQNDFSFGDKKLPKLDFSEVYEGLYSDVYPNDYDESSDNCTNVDFTSVTATTHEFEAKISKKVDYTGDDKCFENFIGSVTQEGYIWYSCSGNDLSRFNNMSAAAQKELEQTSNPMCTSGKIAIFFNYKVAISGISKVTDDKGKITDFQLDYTFRSKTTSKDDRPCNGHIDGKNHVYDDECIKMDLVQKPTFVVEGDPNPDNGLRYKVITIQSGTAEGSDGDYINGKTTYSVNDWTGEIVYAANTVPSYSFSNGTAEGNKTGQVVKGQKSLSLVAKKIQNVPKFQIRFPKIISH